MLKKVLAVLVAVATMVGFSAVISVTADAATHTGAHVFTLVTSTSYTPNSYGHICTVRSEYKCSVSGCTATNGSYSENTQGYCSSGGSVDMGHIGSSDTHSARSSCTVCNKTLNTSSWTCPYRQTGYHILPFSTPITFNVE